jgi:hypothetical protein
MSPHPHAVLQRVRGSCLVFTAPGRIPAGSLLLKAFENPLTIQTCKIEALFWIKMKTLQPGMGDFHESVYSRI